jgi:hypothetical protein
MVNFNNQNRFFRIVNNARVILKFDTYFVFMGTDI